MSKHQKIILCPSGKKPSDVRNSVADINRAISAIYEARGFDAAFGNRTDDKGGYLEVLLLDSFDFNVLLVRLKQKSLFTQAANDIGGLRLQVSLINQAKGAAFKAAPMILTL